MFDVEKLDNENVYNPDLQNAVEAAERTYGNANAYLKMAEDQIENTLKSNLDVKSIYDISNAIATVLALACELYLKTIYICEKRNDSINIDKIWENLKSSSFKLDKNGNPVYLLKINNKEIYTYLKVDENGNRILDSDGNNIYIDDDNNEYKDGHQGKKIRLNGHQLDKLIDLLNSDTRLLLELRVTTIPKNSTEMFNKITIYDFLKTKNIIFGTSYMSNNEYGGLIEKHKKTFEQNRYSGEKQNAINLEFLYHLAKQIKPIAHYKINNEVDPLENIDLNKLDTDSFQLLFELQNSFLNDTNELARKDININDKYKVITNDELDNLPVEVMYLCQFANLRYMSNNLINDCICDITFKEKLQFLISNNYIDILYEVNSNTLYKFIKFFDLDDIKYLSKLIRILISVDRPYNLNYSTKQIINSLKLLNFSIDDIINYLANLKIKYNCKIDNSIFRDLIAFVDLTDIYYDLVDKDITKETNSNFLK